MSARTTIIGRDPASGAGIAVELDAGRIAAIRPASAPAGAWLSAGLVDLQVNGYGGLDLNAPGLTPEMVADLVAMLARLGTTTFLPTLITATEAQITTALRTIAEARRRFPAVAHAVPGVHVEGPSISPQDGPRGAHPAEHVRAPDLAEFERWQAAGGGLVKLVTLAPEHAGAPDYIRALTAQGVIVALGHSAATPDQIRAAVDAGARLSTHLGNGVAATLPRHPNLLWTQLADDRLTASFIADGHHLSADAFRAMLRAKGRDRAILVSDSVALAGQPPGRYRQPVGGDVEISADGRIGVAGTPYLAGAGLPLAADLARAMAMAGLTAQEALPLVTENPGRLLGMHGRLAIGEPADLVLWRAEGDTLAVDTVWVAGQEVR
ncbi:MAG: N-acetylglucosamine-6-phosphate deacetylase [Devosia sp. 67-54]|uniref:N-acetylglucosamine-6-phosphate deacetylase n=1 Tax=unclassified Devosia TaxID=196773 RepID=UPI0009606BC2|nr:MULTISPECIES: amidohydrolase family protein [unclassified Devosia]MBN9307456.1 amidohydrolase family protein [Devosia sp.]OJX16836.1 MAG: N-acetylglucosamine-6-phosphate deacetylase [Devosia sp. 67-54]